MSTQNKVWFITGVSSGFGRHLAAEAAKLGNTVIGTVRKQEQHGNRYLLMRIIKIKMCSSNNLFSLSTKLKGVCFNNSRK